MTGETEVQCKAWDSLQVRYVELRDSVLGLSMSVERREEMVKELCMFFHVLTVVRAISRGASGLEILELLREHGVTIGEEPLL